jgi:DNA-binding transcriptional LysR family regulator
MDARGNRPPTIAAVAATYEAETTAIARGLGISFTTSSVARFYDRPGIVYVPISDRPPCHIALAWNPVNLTPQADALVTHVQSQWSFGDPGPDVD